jgi:hypothetical protein
MQEWEKRGNNNIIMSASNLYYAHPSKITERNLFSHIILLTFKININSVHDTEGEPGFISLILIRHKMTKHSSAIFDY